MDNFPIDIIHSILEYDGRIKYKNGNYVNILHKHDSRYDMVQKLVNKKIDILENAEVYHDEITGHNFYFEVHFDLPYFNYGCELENIVGLVYDYNLTYRDIFEICYYDFRCGILQIKTHI